MKKLILLILLIPTFIFSQNKKENKKAQMAADNWLVQIDKGEYLESWDNAAPYFQNQILQTRWSAALKASRRPLGNLTSRNINSSDFKSELPGAPDGNYYILTYNSSFENKASAIETITLTKDPDGKWKTVGYFIK